jgi:hypothetical protein
MRRLRKPKRGTNSSSNTIQAFVGLWLRLRLLTDSYVTLPFEAIINATAEVPDKSVQRLISQKAGPRLFSKAIQALDKHMIRILKAIRATTIFPSRTRAFAPRTTVYSLHPLLKSVSLNQLIH